MRKPGGSSTSTAAKKNPPLSAPPPVFLPPPRPIDRPKLIDEFGQLAQRLAESRILEQRYEQLRKQIVSWYADSNPDEAYSEEGDHYSVVVGPRAAQRAVTDMRALQERIGPERFLAICSVSMEKLDHFLAQADQRGLVSVERIGPRTVKPIQRYTAA